MINYPPCLKRHRRFIQPRSDYYIDILSELCQCDWFDSAHHDVTLSGVEASGDTIDLGCLYIAFGIVREIRFSRVRDDSSKEC